MSSPSNRILNGTTHATAADQTCDLPGFRPLSVDLYGANGVMMSWHSDMADDSAWKTLADGTRSLVTSNGITPNSTGFALGADSDLNTGTQKITFRVIG